MKIFEGNFLNVYRETKVSPKGKSLNVEYIKHPGAVLIVPYLSDNELLMLKQYRPCIDKVLWEFPAGTLETGEDIAVCAERELEEECGYTSDKIEYVLGTANCPGYSNEIIHIFKASGLNKTSIAHEDDEEIDVVKVTIDEVRKLIDQKEIIDAKTLAALLYVM